MYKYKREESFPGRRRYAGAPLRLKMKQKRKTLSFLLNCFELLIRVSANTTVEILRMDRGES